MLVAIDHELYPSRAATGAGKMLVIGIDVGTTLSAVSYAVLVEPLDPKTLPEMMPSSQKEENDKSGVYSISYNNQENGIATGPAKRDAEIYISLSKTATVTTDLGAHDPVFSTGSFLQPNIYLIERNTFLVLSRLDGWEGKQSQILALAIATGLVDSSAAVHRIILLTEGGADDPSLDFCLDNNTSLLQGRDDALVVDCGGGAIDLTVYSQDWNGSFKDIVKDIVPQNGGFNFFTSLPRDSKGRAKDSSFGADDNAGIMVDKPEGGNCTFRYSNRLYFVKFGSLRGNDRKYGISKDIFKVEEAQQLFMVEESVRLLNAWIGQASCLMVDSLLYRKTPISSEYLDNALDKLAPHIGPSLRNYLRGQSGTLDIIHNPLITQIAFQSSLASACSYIVNNGIPPSDIRFAGTPADTQEAQPSILTIISQNEWDNNRKYLMEMVIGLITAVRGSLENRRALPTQYNEVLEEIVEASIGLYKVMKGQVAEAAELITYTIPCDAEYDPSRMVDTEGNASEIGSSTVICTMEMGLQCRKKERSSKKEWRTVAKAQVVLANTLKADLMV